jgi:hypothetical protein
LRDVVSKRIQNPLLLLKSVFESAINMPVSRELRDRAFQMKHHQRKALKLLGGDRHAPGSGIGPATLQALLLAGLAIENPGKVGESRFTLSDTGRELHAALSELGWFPP